MDTSPNYSCDTLVIFYWWYEVLWSCCISLKEGGAASQKRNELVLFSPGTPRVLEHQCTHERVNVGGGAAGGSPASTADTRKCSPCRVRLKVELILLLLLLLERKMFPPMVIASAVCCLRGHALFLLPMRRDLLFAQVRLGSREGCDLFAPELLVQVEVRFLVGNPMRVRFQECFCLGSLDATGIPLLQRPVAAALRPRDAIVTTSSSKGSGLGRLRSLRRVITK